MKSKRGAALARGLARFPALAATALVVVGCPAPIPHTETTSAPIVGTLEWADGAPVPDADVVVSTAWDNSCGDVVARTRTDDAGAFDLPGTQKHYSVIWIFPGDIAAPRYRVCLSVRDTLRLAYTGYVTYDRAAKADSLACVAWELDATLRLNCAGRTERTVVAGGRWADDSTARDGFYRVLVTQEPKRPKGSRKKPLFDQPYVYVQWLRPDAGGTRHAVVATTGLPVDHNKVWSLGSPRLWRHDGQWVVSLEGYKHDFMGDMGRAEVVFRLGAPGQAALIAGP